jgi:hypothetical protein
VRPVAAKENREFVLYVSAANERLSAVTTPTHGNQTALATEIQFCSILKSNSDMSRKNTQIALLGWAKTHNVL